MTDDEAEAWAMLPDRLKDLYLQVVRLRLPEGVTISWVFPGDDRDPDVCFDTPTGQLIVMRLGTDKWSVGRMHDNRVPWRGRPSFRSLQAAIDEVTK